MKILNLILTIIAADEPKDNLDGLVLVVIFSVFLGAIVLVAIAQFIKILVRHFKKIKKSKAPQVDYLEIFGGASNVVKTEVNLNRVLVEVINKKIVNIDLLKQLGVGVQITGNIFKCSSADMANTLIEYQK